MPEKYLGNKTHFNKPPTMWDGQEVFNTSNLYGNLNVVKNAEEPFTPDINTDGNVNVKKNVNVEENVNVKKDVNVDKNIKAKGEIVSQTEVKALSITLTSRKPFDIPHPNKKGWRLRHVCLEGPESGVYFRGRIKNKTEIDLPNYWKDLVDIDSITVNLTSIGFHQDVIVKTWNSDKVYLHSEEGLPIDCFYYICAERMDGEKLIVEYEGTSINDYPGDNSIYSINQ
jgi:hypothetical protein